jgi:chemotaxis protein histidine kinase CheA
MLLKKTRRILEQLYKDKSAKGPVAAGAGAAAKEAVEAVKKAGKVAAKSAKETVEAAKESAPESAPPQPQQEPQTGAPGAPLDESALRAEVKEATKVEEEGVQQAEEGTAAVEEQAEAETAVGEQAAEAEEKAAEAQQEMAAAQEETAEAGEKEAAAQEEEAEAETKAAESGEKAAESEEKQAEKKESLISVLKGKLIEKIKAPKQTAPSAAPAPSYGDRMMQKSGEEGEEMHVGAVLWIGLNILLAVFIYMRGEVVSVTTFLSFGLFILASLMWILSARYRGWTNLLVVLLAIALFAAGVFMFISATLPHLVAAWESGSLMETAEEAEAAGKTGILKLAEDFKTSFDKQMSMATGQYIQGEVDPQQKDDIGIKILDPWVQSITDIREGEPAEVRARVVGFSPVNPIQVAASCHMQTKKEATDISREKISRAGKGPNIDPGEQQPVIPESFGGHTFDKSITCALGIEACGDYVATISAQADNIKSGARMSNYIMDAEALETYVKEYALEQDTQLVSAEQISSAIGAVAKSQGWQVGDYRSFSDKGAVKVVMVTQPTQLVGVGQYTDLPLRVGVENMMDGWITEINTVEVIVEPDLAEFEPVEGFCKLWKKEGNKLILDATYLKETEFRDVAKGKQKIFPSCFLKPLSSFEEPQELFFRANIDYNYILQKEHNIKVKTKTGEKCEQKEEATDVVAPVAPATPVAGAPKLPDVPAIIVIGFQGATEVDYRYYRSENQWQYDGGFGWTDVSEMGSPYAEGNRVIARALTTKDELEGYEYFRKLHRDDLIKKEGVPV